MKIKLLNSGGYSHKAGIYFPIWIDDENAWIGDQTVRISSSALIKVGFTHVGHEHYIAFCLDGHPFGREAIVL